MRTILPALFSVLAVLLGGVPCAGANESASAPHRIALALPVEAVALARPIDARIFGHFLERPSWAGEIGPEAALIPGTRALRADVVELMRGLRIPVLRFPGGTDVDYQDWTDLIDYAPERTDPRRPVFVGKDDFKVTQEFGFVEHFALARDLGAETILVVNLLDALRGKKPVAAAARHAAGLVAYCNAPAGAALPAGHPDWPALRALHGHPETFGARYVQLGNETWMKEFRAHVLTHLGTDSTDRHLAWAREVLHAYIAAIREVDPLIEIIIDGHTWSPISDELLADPVLRREVRHVAFHTYAPWGVKDLWSEGRALPSDEARQDPFAWWWALQVQGGDFGSDDGQARYLDHAKFRANALGLGYTLAITEWNFVTWWNLPRELRPALSLRAAAGPGTASLLHALLRSPGISLATQSMLVGQSWDITGIRVNPSAPDEAAHYLPNAEVMRLYANHHGSLHLPLEIRDNPLVTPTRFLTEKESLAARAPGVAILDALATRDAAGVIYLHLVNRDPERPVRLILGAGLDRAGPITRHTLAYTPEAWAPRPYAPASHVYAASDEPALPPASVNVLVISPPRAE